MKPVIGFAPVRKCELCYGSGYDPRSLASIDLPQPLCPFCKGRGYTVDGDDALTTADLAQQLAPELVRIMTPNILKEIMRLQRQGLGLKSDWISEKKDGI